jgi:hypothetical protein
MPTYNGAPTSDLTGLSARVIAPSPTVPWKAPPYGFSNYVTLSAGSVSTVYISPQTISVRDFKYYPPELYALGERPYIIYGSGSSGTGGSDVAGLTYINNVWTVYDNQGRIVNTKTVSNSVVTVSKATGVTDGWITGTGVPGSPTNLFIEFKS